MSAAQTPGAKPAPPTDILGALLVVVDLLRSIDSRLSDMHTLASTPGPVPPTVAKAPEGPR